MSAVSTGLISASELNKDANSRGIVSSVMAIADGTNQATVEVFDGADDTGVLLVQLIVDAGLVSKSINLSRAVRYTAGLYIKITGTGAGGIVHIG